MFHRVLQILIQMDPRIRQHLKDVHMSYCQHFLFSSQLSLNLLVGAYKAFLHACIPSLHTISTTELVKALQTKIAKTKNQMQHNGGSISSRL